MLRRTYHMALDQLFPLFDRRRNLRPFGTGRSVASGSTSSVRLRRTSLVATARGPAGAESGAAHPRAAYSGLVASGVCQFAKHLPGDVGNDKLY